MSSASKQIKLDQATKRAADFFQRQQRSERRVVEEEKRHSDMIAKTARLRKQRLERDAAEAEADEQKPKQRGPSK